MAYEDRIDLRGDGRIGLYKRPGLKNPKWQVRLRVPNATDYRVVTTKTTDLEEATRFALNLYEDTYLHVKAGGSIKRKTFREVFIEWKVVGRAVSVAIYMEAIGSQQKDFVLTQLFYETDSSEVQQCINTNMEGDIATQQKTRRTKMARPKGYVCSAETIEKMRAAKLNTSAETKAKLSAAHKGKIRTAEHSAKLAEANRGRVMSAESKAKMSAARKAYYAAKKARKPIYRVFNSEIGTFVQWFQYGETPGQIKTALTLFTSPKGHFEMLHEDGSAEDYARLVQEHENLRPLPPVQLTLI